MHNCIFNAHCLENFCDGSCPILAETSYLLERNGINMKNPVFLSSQDNINKMLGILQEAEGKTYGLIINDPKIDTIRASELLAYCAICKNWKGSNLHSTVYTLKYSIYLDELRRSWGMKAEPDNLEYMRIWSNSAKVLIVSNFDYVNFNEFESQTLLNLIQTRASSGLTTILVSPEPGKLMSTKANNPFFLALKNNWLIKGQGVNVITLREYRPGGKL